MRFWRNLSSNQRLLVAGVAGALAAYWAWPHFRGEVGYIGHQLRRTSDGIPRMLDPFGLLPRGENDYDDAPRRGRRPRGEGDYGEAPGRDLLYRGEGDYAAPPGRRLRLPPRAGYGAADGLPRDRQGRPYRRWRECTGSRQHPHCGSWQTGPAPEDE